MANLIIILDRLILLYMYFIAGACIMSWIPNLNHDYPLFHAIFTAAGFYIIPPFMGLSFSPALVMAVCALISVGLRKIYLKYFVEKDKKIIVVSPEELIAKLKEQQEDYLKKEQEEKDDDSV